MSALTAAGLASKASMMLAAPKVPIREIVFLEMPIRSSRKESTPRSLCPAAKKRRSRVG
jgi:hypothetical protein